MIDLRNCSNYTCVQITFSSTNKDSICSTYIYIHILKKLILFFTFFWHTQHHLVAKIFFVILSLYNLFLASDATYIQGIENLAKPVYNKSCWTYQFFMMCYQKRRNTRQICFHSLQKLKIYDCLSNPCGCQCNLCEQSCFQKQQILILNFTQVCLRIFCWFYA